MPDSSRSSVDLPAPLWPTRPTRSPSSSDIVMSRSASITTTLDSLRPIVPPALPRNAFFSERAFASKMGNSTHALRVSIRGAAKGEPPLQVLPGPGRRGSAALSRNADAGRQGALPHLLQLLARRHLLGEQRGLDAVEQTFQPADELRLGDPELGVGRHAVLGERQRQPLEFVTQFGCEAVLQLADAGLVDLPQPVAAGVVERCGPNFLQQLLDHRADPHHLGGLLDEVGQRLAAAVLLGLYRPVAADDLDVVVVSVRSHPIQIPSRRRAIRRCGLRRCRRSSPMTVTYPVTLARRASRISAPPVCW